MFVRVCVWCRGQDEAQRLSKFLGRQRKKRKRAVQDEARHREIKRTKGGEPRDCVTDLNLSGLRGGQEEATSRV